MRPRGDEDSFPRGQVGDDRIEDPPLWCEPHTGLTVLCKLTEPFLCCTRLIAESCHRAAQF